MPSYQYQATDAAGQYANGQIEADSVEQAIAMLHARELTVQSISRVLPEAATRGSAVPPSPTSAERVEQAVLRAHMATILERGRPIVPGLRAYAAEMPSGAQRRQLLAVCQFLELGDPAAAAPALADLPESWIPLLSAATTSPEPGRVLDDFLSESRQLDNFRRQWWLALTYPVVLVGLAMTVLTALAIFVIPEFRSIFDDFGMELPAMTKSVLSVARFLSSWGTWIIILLFAVFALSLLNVNRWLVPAFSQRLAARFRLPFGRRTVVARFTRFVADLLDAGVSLPDALRIAGFTLHRSPMQQAAWRLANDLERTGEFSPRAYRRPLTAAVCYALAADLPTASRVQLLREISGAHADRVRLRLSWAGGTIEPVAILVVGAVVGWTVIALFLPLVKLIDGLSS